MDSFTTIAGSDKTNPLCEIRCSFFLKKEYFAKDFYKTLGVMLFLLVFFEDFFFFFLLGILYHCSSDTVNTFWDMPSSISVVITSELQGR